jgi:hypothetical protein
MRKIFILIIIFSSLAFCQNIKQNQIKDLDDTLNTRIKYGDSTSVYFTKFQGDTLKTDVTQNAADIAALETNHDTLATFVRDNMGRHEYSILIAALDAPQAIKNVADYVCDGAADEVEINNAIQNNYFTMAWGIPTITIKLSEGTFFISNSINVDKNASIIGAGNNRTFLVKSTTPSYDNIVINQTFVDSYIFILRDIKIIGGGRTAANLANCVTIIRGNEFTFENVEFTQASGANVRFARTGGNEASWNSFQNCWFFQQGVAGLLFDETSTTGTTNVIINGCHFFGGDNIAPAVTVPSIWVKNGANVTGLNITGNSIRKGGFLFEGGTTYTIVGNTFVDKAGDYGIKFGNRASSTNLNSLISGNNFAGSGTYTNLIHIGTNVNYVDVLGNRLYGEGTNKIFIESGANANGLIANNSPETVNTNAAYTDRLKWDGGSTGLVAATGRTSLGATTIGSNLFTLTNPSAISFLRLNADNTVTARSAANFKTDLSLNNVENTALSTWVGSSNITTLGTVTNGTWNAGAVTSSGDIYTATAFKTITLSLGLTGLTQGASGGNQFDISPNKNMRLFRFTADTTAEFQILMPNDATPKITLKANTGSINMAGGITALGSITTSTRFLAPNGTNSVPAYSFTNKTNSGWIMTAAGVLQYISNSVPKIRVDSSGYTSVIGAAITPKFPFSVGAFETVVNEYDAYFAVKSGTQNKAILIEENTGVGETWSIGVDLDGDLGFYNSADANPTVEFNDGGNIGFGTTDLDGTPAAGRVTIKASNNDGSSNIIVGRNSGEENKFRVSDRGSVYQSGGFYPNLTNSTNGYGVQPYDHRIYLDESAGGGDVFMPAGVNGWELTFTKTDASANPITLYPSGSETIVGEISYDITSQYQSITMQYNAAQTTWYIIASYTKP